MRLRTFFNTKVIHVSVIQIYITSACIFVPYQGEFVASLKYEMKTNEEECLQTCCVEGDCTYVRYDLSVCTIFKEGNDVQSGVNMVYVVDRQLVIPQCSLSIDSTVDFQTSLRMKDGAIELEAATELNDTNFYSVVFQFKNDNAFYFTQDASPDGSTPLNMASQQRGYFMCSAAFGETVEEKFLIRNPWNKPVFFSYYFAKNSQPNCVSVPVFTDENARKLYLGNTYNGTGYKFMDAFAFTDKCVSTLEESYYCVPLSENSAEDTATSGIEIEANQTLYLADIITQEGDYLSDFYNCSEF